MDDFLTYLYEQYIYTTAEIERNTSPVLNERQRIYAHIIDEYLKHKTKERCQR